jgi:two-component system sensor histidine kinase CpxA
VKTPFPLFARLLAWFFINLLILAVGILLLLRAQFGSMRNWLLPEASQNQIQGICVTLIGELSHSDRANWGPALSRLSAAYHMDFALFDHDAHWLAGAPMQPPRNIRQSMTYPAIHQPPSPLGPGMPPPWDPAQAGGPQPGPPPDGSHPPPPPGTDRPSPQNEFHPPPTANAPDFPKNVLHTDEPSAYWLLVRLPPEQFPMSSGPITLVGTTPALGISPLLFNPRPWIAVPAGVILFSILFWFPLARSLTRSITEMTRATESIAEGRFDIHLADNRRDELGRLGNAINRMTSRLKDFVTGQKRFLGDAAHELCSPLARMEIALSILEERSNEESRPLVQDVRDEVTHMRELANELLSFSKAALGENRLQLGPVHVATVIDAAIHLEKNSHQALEIDAPPDLAVHGHAELLRRALANLLRNAIRYAGDAGPISIRAWPEESGLIVITVSDQGPGVPPGEIGKLFDPFYRVDQSRTSETGGTGLGLAIVRTCVEACKGTVGAANLEPTGLQVWIRLNRA